MDPADLYVQSAGGHAFAARVCREAAELFKELGEQDRAEALLNAQQRFVGFAGNCTTELFDALHAHLHAKGAVGINEFLRIDALFHRPLLGAGLGVEGQLVLLDGSKGLGMQPVQIARSSHVLEHQDAHARQRPGGDGRHGHRAGLFYVLWRHKRGAVRAGLRGRLASHGLVYWRAIAVSDQKNHQREE